jgi:hypothetical protein
MVLAMRPRLPRLVAFALLALLGGCGFAAQDRPVVVATEPADGQSVPAPLSAVRVTYDEPVRILNPNDIQIAFLDAAQAVTAWQDPADPQSVYASLADGTPFPTDVDVAVRFAQGAVANSRDHYARDAYAFAFRVVGAPSMLVVAPGRVALVDAESLQVTAARDVPTGRAALAALGTTRGGRRLVWVQLDGGGGAGRSLAVFDPASDAPMATVPLTASGDLVGTTGALVMEPDGSSILAAWRDTGSGAVRLTRIDVGTGTEAATLVLGSVPPGRRTRPLGIALEATGTWILVACEDGAGRTIAWVDRARFQESDFDVCIQLLPSPAGPVASSDVAVSHFGPQTSLLASAWYPDGARCLLLLDARATRLLTRWTWTEEEGLVPDDPEPSRPGAGALDLTDLLPGAHALGTVHGPSPR